MTYLYNENTGKLLKATDSNGLEVNYTHNSNDEKLLKMSSVVDGLENANEFDGQIM